MFQEKSRQRVAINNIYFLFYKFFFDWFSFWKDSAYFIHSSKFNQFKKLSLFHILKVSIYIK